MIFVFLLVFILGCQTVDQNRENDEPSIKETVAELISEADSDTEKMERIFYFVRDEIEFGWVYPQTIPPEEVLAKKRGVCMQKANLLVAMAREAGLEARFHFMYVHKTALEDFLPGYAYKNWIDPFPHTIPEVYLEGEWVSMEATLDKELHDLCLEKELNFGKNPDISEAVQIEFSPKGVKGHQQYVEAEGMSSFYGNDLSEFSEYLHNDVPWWKQKMQPMIFRQAQNIMNKIRENNEN